jgi:hypothetical protein
MRTALEILGYQLCVEMEFQCDPGTAGEDHVKARFIEHYQHIRDLVPKENLLEYRVGEGWEILCAFLGNDVPEANFPWTNDTQMLLKRLETWTWAVYRRMTFRALIPATVLTSIGIALYTNNIRSLR